MNDHTQELSIAELSMRYGGSLHDSRSANRNDLHDWLTTAIDVIISAAALIALIPLFLIVAAAIKVSTPGPVLFRQNRTGLNGKTFKIIKFCTMTTLEDGSTIKQVTQGDPRVTAIGRLLRCTSIDELPQLINVIMGDMSLVGPRPHALAHDVHFSEYVPEYNSRFSVKPGITGWAQINGSRGATPKIEDMRDRVDLDLWYIKNRNLKLYFSIMYQTLLKEFARSDRAY